MKHESSSAHDAEQSATQAKTCSTTFSTSFLAGWSSTGSAGWSGLKFLVAAPKIFTVGSTVRMIATMSLLMMIAAAKAQQSDLPISTDRPSFSDGPLIVPMGHWQIEGGYTYTRQSGETFGELLIRYPVSQRIEMRISNLSFGRFTGDPGLLDPVIGAKWSIQSGTLKRPALTIVAQTTLPAGARPFRVDRSQPTAKFVWYQQTNDTTGFGGNLLISDLGIGNSRFTQVGASAYVSKTVNTSTGVFGEVYVLGPVAKGGSAEPLATWESPTFSMPGLRLIFDLDRALTRDGTAGLLARVSLTAFSK